jgi:hypothetical protein
MFTVFNFITHPLGYDAEAKKMLLVLGTAGSREWELQTRLLAAKSAKLIARNEQSIGRDEAEKSELAAAAASLQQRCDDRDEEKKRLLKLRAVSNLHCFVCVFGVRMFVSVCVFLFCFFFFPFLIMRHVVALLRQLFKARF